MLLTIGLEIHVKLKSPNKMFCQCKNEQNFDSLQPNTNICPVCTGQPGALPTLSKEVLQQALLLGKALHCTINEVSKFDRKSYFYPDLPMGYQITQFYQPTNTKGEVKFFLDNYTAEKTVHIAEAHMECDTAKMIHVGNEALLDFNRAGTPLVEIVTNPDFTSVDEVIEFLKEIQRILRYNNISDADMEKGQMRCDVNISLRQSEKDPFGIRTETKNINSFGMIKRAIEFEQARQEKLYAEGKTIDQETRGRDDAKGESTTLRSKEDALDYRYFPEPDMPELRLDDETLKRLNEQSVEIPYDTIKTFRDFGFNKEYINALINDKEILHYFNYFVTKKNDPKTVAKRICGPIIAWLKDNLKSINELKFNKDDFESFLIICKEGKVIENQLKLIIKTMLEEDGRNNPNDIIEKRIKNSEQNAENNIEKIAGVIIKENPAIVDQYKKGKTTVIAFFIGKAMQVTRGTANPQQLQEIFEKLLA